MIRENYEELYVKIFGNLDEMEKLLEKLKLSQLHKKKRKS